MSFFFQKKKTFLHRTSIKDGCNNCKCNNGIVACAYTSITIGCLYLQNKETTTVPPNGCKFEGQYRYIRILEKISKPLI